MIEWHSEDGNWITAECDGCGAKPQEFTWDLRDLDKTTATRKLGESGWIMFQTFLGDASPIACGKPKCVGIASTKRLEDVERSLREIAPVLRACLPREKIEGVLFDDVVPSAEERGRRDGLAGVAPRELSARYMVAWRSASRIEKD